jgi:hypothetical protein
MDRLHYAGHSILTGTAIARAILDYAQALAEANTSATIDVPTLNDDGSLGRSEILIGPASQLITDSEESKFADVIDDEFVARLRNQAAHIRAHGADGLVAEVRETPPAPQFHDYEY